MFTLHIYSNISIDVASVKNQSPHRDDSNGGLIVNIAIAIAIVSTNKIVNHTTIHCVLG
jgi:hypothetical protein